MLETLIGQLAGSQPLSTDQVGLAVEQLIDEKVAPALKADFLSELARKGETTEEIAAFARCLRDKSVSPDIDASWRRTNPILDVCGTGGDRLHTFNISTTVALICAAAGVAVAKHGNRAITSQAGSADVLEELGVRINLSPSEAAQSLQQRNFAFFFAPNYHPAFKHIAPARKLCAERGQRTIFNFLGPLLNPARPTAQLIGVARPDLCEPMATVLQSLGIRSGMVVSGRIPDLQLRQDSDKWLDELSTLGHSTVTHFLKEGAIASYQLSPEKYSVQPASLADLLGGDRGTNAQIVKQLVQGQERGPKRDAVLLNAAAALYIGEKSLTIEAGWQLAAEIIDSGQAAQKLQQLQKHG